MGHSAGIGTIGVDAGGCFVEKEDDLKGSKDNNSVGYGEDNDDKAERAACFAYLDLEGELEGEGLKVE